MPRPRDDWLDVLARHAAGGATPLDRPLGSNDPVDDGSRFSRAAASRLALAAVASVVVAGVRPPAARAETREQCVTGCAERWTQNHDRVVAGCARLYRDANSNFYSKPGWSRVARLFAGSGWRFVGEAVRHALWHECVENETARELRNASRCVARCEASCPTSGAAATCRGTPPHTPEPPSVPSPPPTGENDYCAPGGACDQVGGKCCGPPTGIPGINVCLDASQCP